MLLGSAASATFTTSNATYEGDPIASGLLQLSDAACDHHMQGLIGGDAIVLTTGGGAPHLLRHRRRPPVP
jgi:hypothetical protein